MASVVGRYGVQPSNLDMQFSCSSHSELAIGSGPFRQKTLKHIAKDRPVAKLAVEESRLSVLERERGNATSHSKPDPREAQDHHRTVSVFSSKPVKVDFERKQPLSSKSQIERKGGLVSDLLHAVFLGSTSATDSFYGSVWSWLLLDQSNCIVACFIGAERPADLG
ncbi:hypothetical protein WAI453_001950 [Rhynchosporium graminicola]